MRASRSSPIAFPVTQNRSTRTKTTRVNRTLTSDLFDRIRLDILHCNLQPGSRLLFRDLRATYGSGQSPLREALMRLASEQLVVLEDHSVRCFGGGASGALGNGSTQNIGDEPNEMPPPPVQLF